MKKIKMFVMDVDGTMTDGKINMGANGELFKSFDIKDGYGVHEILPDNGVITVIMTGRKSDIVLKRAAELEINVVLQHIKDKKTELIKLAQEYEIDTEEIAYIGDDMMDFEAMELCGLKGCPANAVKGIRKISDYICDVKGGDGAVREFIDWLIDNDYVIGKE